MFIDSHCHLNCFPKEMLAQIIDSALESRVNYILTVSASYEDFEEVIKIAQEYPFVYATAGIHPAGIEKLSLSSQEVYQWLIKCAKHPKVVGFGESGIDLFEATEATVAPLDMQIEYFRAHIRASIDSEIPLSIHSRNADTQTYEQFEWAEKEYGKMPKGVLHCFTGSKEFAKKAWEKEFLIGFSGIVTFKNAKVLREIVRDVPKEKMLIETDAPWLAPAPYRGKQNQPSYVVEVAKVLAAEKGYTLEDIGKMTTQNFFNLFTKAKKIG